MASMQPIVRQIRLSAYIIQIIIIFIIIVIYNLFDANDPFLSALITYLVIKLLLRYSISLNHRRGIKLYRGKKYKEAIKEFEKSYAYFDNHRWIDKYRSIVLLSVGRMSYLEMALINIAYCYSQIGEGAKSKEHYERTLIEFPDSQMAISVLKMFEAAKEIN
jgi:tetratricopeptide (TPR) repeat protein